MKSRTHRNRGHKQNSLEMVRFNSCFKRSYFFFSKNSKVNIVITLIKYILIITGQLMSQFINCILIFPPLGSGFNSLRISFYLPQKWDMILIYQEQRGSLSQVKFEAICLERQNRGFRLGTLDKCIRH